MIPKIVELVRGGGRCNFNSTKLGAALLSKVRNPFCELLGYFLCLMLCKKGYHLEGNIVWKKFNIDYLNVPVSLLKVCVVLLQ